MSDRQSLGAEHVDMELLEAALEEIRPVLHGDGGDLILHGVNDAGVVRIELLGACGNCPLSIVTLVAGIEALVVKRVPGVAGVISYAPPQSREESTI